MQTVVQESNGRAGKAGGTGHTGSRSRAPARSAEREADPALDPLDLKTQLIDGVGTVVGGPPDGGRPAQRGDGHEGHGEGSATGADDTGSTMAAEWDELPWHEVPSPRSAGAARTTGSTARSGTGVSVRTGAGPGACIATGTAAAAGVVTEQQKSRDSRANAQPSEAGRPKRHRCRSVLALTLVMARHRSRCMKIQRIWVTEYRSPIPRDSVPDGGAARQRVNRLQV